jgi:lysozyme
LVGVELIKEFEGCNLRAYPDPITKAAPITIGWGSTRRRDGTGFMRGTIITQSEADDLLMFDIQSRFFPALQKIPYWEEMNDNQRGALLSFAYNLGANFYGSSGYDTITRVLKNKEWDKVPDAMCLYINPGSSVEEGLLRRRKTEGELWSKT